MDEPRDYQIKLNKSERERQISYDITYMWNLKYELIYETDPGHREQICACRGIRSIKESCTGSLELAMETVVYRMGEQGPTI